MLLPLLFLLFCLFLCLNFSRYGHIRNSKIWNQRICFGLWTMFCILEGSYSVLLVCFIDVVIATFSFVDLTFCDLKVHIEYIVTSVIRTYTVTTNLWRPVSMLKWFMLPRVNTPVFLVVPKYGFNELVWMFFNSWSKNTIYFVFTGLYTGLIDSMIVNVYAFISLLDTPLVWKQSLEMTA